MNREVALSTLSISNPEISQEELLPQVQKQLFDIKNFIFMSTAVPYLFNAKRKRLVKIQDALDVLFGSDQLKQTDEERFGELEKPEGNPVFKDSDRAYTVLNETEQSTFETVIRKYEKLISQEKLNFSRAQSAKYMNIFLSRLIELDCAYLILFYHFFENQFSVEQEKQKEVKQNNQVLTPEILEIANNLGFNERKIGERIADLYQSNEEVEKLKKEFIRIHKTLKL
jgi:DnaJ-domain-containing protein 1